MKLCSKCGVEKDLSEFSPHPRGIYKKQPQCKKCRAAMSTEYKRKRLENDKDFNRKNNLKQNYGITLDEYNKMYENQKGCCKICGEHQESFSVTLAVDHCHTTGKVRGLLCRSCNTALGSFRDNITNLQSAIDYLKEHQNE